jgi:Tfp pilus assembly protein PilO
VPRRAGDHDARLHDLHRPGEHEDRARRVADLEPVRQELVEVGEEAHGLLGRALPHLDDRTDLLALTVEDRVLVGQLDELRLL